MCPSPMPLHHQLRETLLNRILRGEWRPGEAMPTEHELATEYGVSRQTIREAIRALRYEGVVEARRGSGTYVREPAEGGPVSLVRGRRTVVQEGTAPWSTRLIRRERRAVGEAEASLEVPVGTPVELTEKLRLRGGQPFCLTYSFCLAVDGAARSPRRGDGLLTILATVLHPYEARLLEDSPHTAALQLEMLQRDTEGRPVSFHRIVVPNANLRVDDRLGSDEVRRLGSLFDVAGLEEN